MDKMLVAGMGPDGGVGVRACAVAVGADAGVRIGAADVESVGVEGAAVDVPPPEFAAVFIPLPQPAIARIPNRPVTLRAYRCAKYRSPRDAVMRRSPVDSTLKGSSLQLYGKDREVRVFIPPVYGWVGKASNHYVYADPECGCLYVGSPQALNQYVSNQQLDFVHAQQMAVQDYVDPAWNWAAWGRSGPLSPLYGPGIGGW
jgi:hypothetical protein